MKQENLNCKPLLECLACGSDKLVPVLDLGTQPLANSYLKNPEETELTFPLALNVCQNCWHCQLTHAVNPDLMFKDYSYVSGTSQTLKDYFVWFANFSIQKFCQKNNRRQGPSNVLDIACNDGTQLDAYNYANYEMETYGLDPAENLYAISKAKNHTIVCDYLNSDSVKELKSLSSKPYFHIINAQNVFAHNADPLGFLKNCYDFLADDGYLFIQNSQTHMIENGEFDTMYHEHISFWNASSMQQVTHRAGLTIVDRVRTPIHGISDLFILEKTDYPYAHMKFENELKMEEYLGLHNIDTYNEFGDKARKVINDFDLLLEDFQYKLSNHLFVGYGAAAKGNTFLNAGKFKLDYIIDENPLKQGTYAPGTHIPIVDDRILMTNNDIIFVPLAWNFKKEIISKIRKKRPGRKNDYCLTYFPRVGYEKL